MFCKHSLVSNLLQRQLSINCLFNLAKKWSLQVQFVWPYRQGVIGSALKMNIIHVTKGNRGGSQAEMCDVIGDSIKMQWSRWHQLSLWFCSLTTFTSTSACPALNASLGSQCELHFEFEVGFPCSPLIACERTDVESISRTQFEVISRWL